VILWTIARLVVVKDNESAYKITVDPQGLLTCHKIYKLVINIVYISGKWTQLEVVTFDLQNCILIEHF
jgi:hypothetical protein